MSALRSLAPTFLIALCLTTLGSFASAAGYEDLFDGETLKGWTNPYDHGDVWVEDGAICLRANKKFFLATEETFGDFILEAEIMLPAEGVSNSGICFRCHVEPGKVFGYQAECDPSPRGWTGGLYDEGRRGWLSPKKSETLTTKILQAPLGEWIKYRIECEGNKLQIEVNGKPTTFYLDDVDSEGHIAIQHHGEKGQIYRFRNIKIHRAHGHEHEHDHDADHKHDHKHDHDHESAKG